ncbi:MAG: rhomboid family intramembrane serine protease [Parachlamydiaceae bacterium]|nr:rhomboid family intramembrane serine protease [Parachlamydiaceae bacterium]
MSYTSSYGGTAAPVSKALRYLMWTLAIVSIFCALVDGFFIYYLEMNGPQALLSLSWNGLKNWYIWQPLSYLFVLSSGNGGLSFSFFWELFIDLYVLWIFGGSLLDRIGNSAFFRFYFVIGIIVGLATLLCMPLLKQYTTLAGPGAPLLAIITLWTMLNLESELLLFFLIPFKAKWIFTAIFGVLLLINISHLNFIGALFDIFSVLGGYLYGTLAWELASPFAFTEPLDKFLIKLGNQLRSLISFEKSTTLKADKESKIFDFASGTILEDDDVFMDNALNKISKFGEKSLTWSERARMKKISEKKARQRKND